MNKAAIIVDNVTFGYDEASPILKDVTLEIPFGQIVAIMGGSGSGKTTLLRLISGQYKAQKGKVYVLGHDVAKLSHAKILELRKSMGMLFQFGALFTDMSVEENVAFALKEHTNIPDSVIKKIVAMKLAAVGLFGTQSMMPQQLSGGMARRVALARSIALDPAIMLYDEPFTGLDPISLNVASMLIKKLNESLEQTSILVTHDIETTMKIVDHIYFMADGKLIDGGTPKEVYETKDPKLRQFMQGELIGPYNYEYSTKLNYTKYLGDVN